jgi:hypothetical protein
MTVVAPRQPIAPQQPLHDELEALIEEARRRGRRRRRAFVVAALFAAMIGGAVWAAVALRAGGGTTAGTAPRDFHLVKARGPVAHRLFETWILPQPTSIDLATGHERPARTTWEIWFDRRSGLTRVVARVDGRIQSDRVETCSPVAHGGPCVPAYAAAGFSFEHLWPPDSHQYVREPGTGIFRGREVVWLGKVYNGFPPAPRDGERVGLDPRTHEPLAYRSFLMAASSRKPRCTLACRRYPAAASRSSFRRDG